MTLNQKGGSKTDTVVKLVLVFFISLLSFSVGTFVGKQFSDSQHRLATLENEYNRDSNEGRSMASIPTDGMDVEPSEILSNEDVAKLAEEFVQDKKVESKRDVANADILDTELSKPANKPIPSQQPKTSAQESAEIIAKRTGKDISEYAAEKVAANKAPLQAVKADIKKTTPPVLPETVAGDAKGKYTIQVSAHQNEPEAKNKVNELIGKGFVANYNAADVNGKKWYRVGVGTFGTVRSAKDYLDKVKENPTFKGAIVRQIVQ